MGGYGGLAYASALLNDKMVKVEGMKRKKRRMKLKAKGNADVIIEKFSAQSSKSAKFARSVIKKREPSEARKFTDIVSPDSTAVGVSSTKKAPSDMAVSVAEG